MDIKVIKQIIDLMNRSDLSEFEIEEEGLRLRISRHGRQSQAVAEVAPQPAPAPAASPVAPAPVAAPAAAAPIAEGKLIRSPMVGTFYTAPSPDSAPFIQVGDSLKADTTVCIIEAMKVMNEIKAEVSGTVAEILVENGESVEYGQPLIRLK